MGETACHPETGSCRARDLATAIFVKLIIERVECLCDDTVIQHG